MVLKSTEFINNCIYFYVVSLLILYGCVLQRLGTTKFMNLIGWNQYWKRSRGAYHSTKISKFSKRGQMVRKFPGKSSRKSVNSRISEKQTIQRKILGWKSNGMEISTKKFSKIWVNLTRLSSFLEFMQIPNFLLSAS